VPPVILSSNCDDSLKPANICFLFGCQSRQPNAFVTATAPNQMIEDIAVSVACGAPVRTNNAPNLGIDPTSLAVDR
jgi:hypothetical protein